MVPPGLPDDRPSAGRAVLVHARTPVDIEWRFEERADLEAVVRIEFSAEVAEEALAAHSGTTVDYAVNVWSKDF